MKSKRAVLDGAYCHIDVAMARDQDDRPSSTTSIEVLHQIEPGHARHPDIGYDAIKRLPLIERRQKLLGGLEAQPTPCLAKYCCSASSTAPSSSISATRI